MSLRVLLERLTKQRQVQIPTDHLVKILLLGGKRSTDNTTKYKKRQKTVSRNVLTIDNVTVKNITSFEVFSNAERAF